MRGILTTRDARREYRIAWRGPAAVLAAASMLTAALATGCSAGPSAARRPQPGPARLTISPQPGEVDDRPDLGVVVSAAGGRLTGVNVRDEQGDPVPGYLDPTGSIWHSRWALAPARTYAVSATAVNPRGRAVLRRATFQTAAALRTFTASVDMAPGETVGVGMPVMVTFSRAIHDRAAVEQSFELRSSKPVVGAWYWLDSRTVWFRPKRFWPAYTRVAFTAHLAGVRGADNVYGAANLSRHFRIGASIITVASTSSHRMRVWVGGRLAYDWPISTGQPGDDTPDGAYLTIEKGNPVDMDSCSYGVCAGDPGYYNVLVYDSVRFTWSGDYIHSAPWSVGEQGYANVSHGCVNLAPAYAAWYYVHANRGDPVRIVGSPVAGTWGDGWTIWFLSWRALLKGSSLRRAVAAGPGGSSLASPQTPPAAPVTPAPVTPASATPASATPEPAGASTAAPSGTPSSAAPAGPAAPAAPAAHLAGPPPTARSRAHALAAHRAHAR